MDFTIEEITKQWNILNDSSSSISDKKQADIYLTNFKKSPMLIPIVLQLFNFSDPSIKIFSSLLIYQEIKENNTTYHDSKEKFSNIKSNIFSSIVPLLDNCQPIVIDRICYAISILILIGTITYWPDAIEDTLQFAKTSNINCYIAITALANCSTELKNLNISTKRLIFIKNMLIDKKESVKQFIDMILSNVNNFTQDVFTRLYVKTVELANAWVEFELNSLQMPKMIKMLLNDINEDNITVISALLCKSIELAKGAKYEISNNEEFIDGTLNKCNKEEMETINYIIDVIYNYTKHGNCKEKIIEEFAKIVSTVTENFIFLFFLKKNISQKLYDLFITFISNRKKRISQLLFETIHTMKTFINVEYKFINYSNDEKVQFSNYLIKVIEAIIFHCKKKQLKVESDIMIENISINMQSQFPMESENIDYEENDISSSDYRNNAEDVFFHLFLIFEYNFHEDGVNFFLQSIMKLIQNDNINIYDANILNNTNKLLACEVVLFVLKSISNCFESLHLNVSSFLQFITYILHSKIIENRVILIYFLLLLESSSIYISKETNSYSEIILFLLQLSISVRELSKLATIIILNITDGSKVYNENIFKEIYKVYLQNYDTFDQPSIANLSESLCACSAIVSDDTNNNNQLIGITYDELILLFIEIAKPATERIRLITEILNAGNYENNIKSIKYEITKNYSIHEKILKYAYFTENENFMSNFLEYHLESTFNYTSLIFSIFNTKDSTVISVLTKIFIKFTEKLSFEKFHSYSHKICEMMSSSYLSNKDNFLSLYVIRNLYSTILKKSKEQQKQQDITTSFFEILKLITQNIPLQSNNIIDVFIVYSQFFAGIYPKIVTNYSNVEYIQTLDRFIDFYLEALKSIIENDLINNIFRVLIAFIQKSQVELVSTKILKIVTVVFESIEHYSSSTLTFFTNFISACIMINKANFIQMLLNIFENSQEYKIFSKKEREIIIEFLDKFGNDKDKLTSILKDLVNITKGRDKTDILNHYEIQLAKLKVNNKIN